MEIDVVEVKENTDGSAFVTLKIDADAKTYLLEQGIARIMENALAFEEEADL